MVKARQESASIEGVPLGALTRLYSALSGLVARVHLRGPPTDLQLSDRLVDQLVHERGLPPDTARFVLALPLPESNSVVYILSTQLLSERAVNDTKHLVSAVHPAVVVSQVSRQLLWLILAEENRAPSPSAGGILKAAAAEPAAQHVEALNGAAAPTDVIKDNAPTVSLDLGAAESFSSGPSSQSSATTKAIPTTIAGVLTQSFVQGSSLEDYEHVASDEMLKAIFGTTLLGPVAAAREAASQTDARFVFLTCPDTEEAAEGARPNGAAHAYASAAGTLRHLVPAQPLLYDQLAEGLLQARATRIPDGGAEEQEAAQKSPRRFANPGFAAQQVVPFVHAYAGAFPESVAMGQALEAAGRCMQSVAAGRGPEEEDLKRLWPLRQAVELLRRAGVQKGRDQARQSRKAGPPKMPCGRPTLDAQALFAMASEEQSKVLLSQALRQLAASERQSLVAVVEPRAVPGVLQYWHTEVGPEGRDFARKLLLDAETVQGSASDGANRWLGRAGLVDGGESDSKRSDDENVEEGGLRKVASLAVSMGAAASLAAASLWGANWGYASTAAKLLGLKLPSAYKAALLLMERSASVAGLKAALPAAHWAAPAKLFSMAPHAALSGKAAVGAKAATVCKSSSPSSGLLFQTASEAAYRFAFQLSRTALYGLMRTRERPWSATWRPRPWLLQGTVAACGVLLLYREEIQRTAAVLPAAARVAQMGRGVAGLQQACTRVNADEAFWRKGYGALDGSRWGALRE